MKSYILKFNKTMGDYCIEENKENSQKIQENGRKNNNFSLFSRLFVKNQQSEDQNTQEEKESSPSVSVGEGVALLDKLYINLRLLNNIYSLLQGINGDYSQKFGDFISQNRTLIGGVLNIIGSVSDDNFASEDVEEGQNSSQMEEIIEKAEGVISTSRDINNRLIKLFNVEDFSRQFNLIENTLALQAQELANIKIQSLKNKILSILQTIKNN